MMHPQKFFATGISFKKTDLELRSKFAFEPALCSSTYSGITSDYLQHFFILSTCNRTEIYGFAPCEYVMLSLLQRRANASSHEMSKYVYVKEGNEAVNHFLSVASGLDSQIPGDYEITSQIKAAFQLSKKHGCINGYLERLFNYGMQASKEVKVSTSFSNGTVSAIYAAARKVSKQKNLHKVVVLGAGSTGLQIVEYLRKLLPNLRISLINRDTEKLKPVASMFNIQTASLKNLRAELKDADTMIVATNANEILVNKEHLIGSRMKYIFDLSVPQNVAQDVCSMDQVKYYNLDSISTLTDATIQERLSQIPKVKAIVINFEKKFCQWSARHYYFSVASHACVDGNPLSRKELAGLFYQWHSFQCDSGLVPYSESAGSSILLALKSAYPNVQLTQATHKPALNASCSHNSMTRQCNCHSDEESTF